MLGAATRLIPDPLLARLLPAGRSFDPAALPQKIDLPTTAMVRLLVAPENSAGQGEAWARAARAKLNEVAAMSLVVGRDAVFGYEAGNRVPPPVFAWSGRWQREHRRAIAERVTHVLLESGRPILAGGVRGDVEHDLRWLRKRGIGCVLVWHGSDVRDPDRHAARHPLSPYADPSWTAVESLRVSSARNRQLAAASGLLSLVSTPDLLDDVPGSTWLPVVVDGAAWAVSRPPLAHGGRLRVVHAPSRGVIKGTALVEPVLCELAAEGVIDYRRIERVPNSEMLEVLQQADVVLDQFRLGIYGVGAVEALAAGRIVIGDVDDRVRARVREATGHETPIISTRPDDLGEILREIASSPGSALELAATGPGFASEVHDGRRAAAVIAEALGLASDSEGTA